MAYYKKNSGSYTGSLLRLMQVLCVAGVLAGTVGCDFVKPDADDKTEKGGNAQAELSFFEEELVGLRSRYHAYDGSTQYIRFNADRTACKWEEASGSNRRVKASNYTSWEIDTKQSSGNERYAVKVKGAGLSWTFDYPRDYVWPNSYTNLKYRPSSEGKACE